MEAILRGGLAGLAYGFLLGPLFFIGLKLTLTKGFKHGLMLVAGAFISDVLLILASWRGAQYLSDYAREGAFHTTLGTVSALLVIGFGISAMWPRKMGRMAGEEQAPDPTTEKYRYSMLKGFLLNMANPSNWLFWLSMGAAAHSENVAPGQTSHSVLFLISAMTVVCASDICKVLLTHQIGQRITPIFIRRVVFASGLLLMAVGIWMLINLYTNIV
jgi:threonine/homoserine/homoserine lactone efflux protein